MLLLVLGCAGSGPLGEGLGGLGEGPWTEQFQTVFGEVSLEGDQAVLGFDFVFEGPEELLESIEGIELELGVHGEVLGEEGGELVLYRLPASYDGGALGPEVEIVDRAVVIGEQGFQHGLKSEGELETWFALKLDGETELEFEATGWAWVEGEDRPDGELELLVLESP